MSADEQFETKLAILADILTKKRGALLSVLAISENQESLYASEPSPERRDFLMQMGQEKQVHIDDVLACDDVFQGIFDSIAGIFEEKGKVYAEQVKALQASIAEVLELDIKIRAQEEKTKIAAQAAWGQRPNQSEAPPAARANLLEQYKNNNRNRPR